MIRLQNQSKRHFVVLLSCAELDNFALELPGDILTEPFEAPQIILEVYAVKKGSPQLCGRTRTVFIEEQRGKATSGESWTCCGRHIKCTTVSYRS